MRELLAYLAIQSATKLKDPGLEQLIRSHRSDGGNPYGLFTCPIEEVHLASLFEKFCKKAILSTNSPKEAFFPVNEFSSTDIRAFVWMLSKRGIHSEFRPVSGFPSTLYLAISDQNNMHLAFQLSPVSSIEMRKNALEEDARRLAAAEALKAAPLYIPPFNVMPTDTDGLYVLLDHMTAQKTTLLEQAFHSRNISFVEKDCETSGHIFVVPFKHAEELVKAKKEARSPANEARDPRAAEIYNIPNGYPTINILKGRGELCIPLEGIMPMQIERLEARLRAQVGLPFEKKESLDFGLVLSFPAPFEKNDEYHARLSIFSGMLRQEYISNNTPKSTAATAIHSADPLNIPRPA